MKRLIITVAAAGWPLLAAGCNQNEAEAEPREVGVPLEEVQPSLQARPGDSLDPGERRDPVVPGEDGVVEPGAGEPLMPPDVIADPDSLADEPRVPDAEDQLERDRVEEANPQGI